MLTMPKLISAMLVAFVGWVVSGMVKQQVLAVYGSYNFGWFVPLCIIVGLATGWLVLGSRANGRLGFGTAPAVGVTAVAMMVFWVLVLISINEMLRQALDRRFRGAMEALQELPKIASDYGQYLLTAQIIGSLVVMGMLAGWIADLTARRWK